MKKLTLLGTVVAVAMAIGAVSAPASQAAKAEFRCTHSSTANCIVKNKPAGAILKLGGESEIGCTLEVAGEMPVTSPSLTVSANISNCKMFGKKLSVEMNGCVLTFHPDNAGFGLHYISTDITCPEGKSITIKPTGINCTWTINSQAGLPGVTMEEVQLTGEEGSLFWNLETKFGLNNITYTDTGTECFNSPGVHSDGGVTATIMLEAYESIGGVPGKQRPLRL